MKQRRAAPGLFDVAPAAWSAADLVALIRRRYAGNAYAVFEQVQNTTGARGDRYADAIAMDLWPSNGLHVHGFEVKVSRSDWTRELRDPKKADAVARYCDCWWIVAPPSIVGPSELLPGWGLLEPHQGVGWEGAKLPFELRVVVGARPTEPQPALDRGFVAAVLRRAAADAKGAA